MHDVIVADEEFLASREAVETAAYGIDRMLRRYLSVMKFAARHGLRSGAAAGALEEFIASAEKLQNVCSRIAQHHSEVSRSFAAAVDNADEYLY